MLRKNVVKGALALSAVAALFAAINGQAQTPATDTGKPGANSPTTVGQATATAPAATGSGSGVPSSLSKSDQKIIKDMALANMAEVEAGRMAQGKSNNEQVRTFAQQMIDDHGKALDDIKQLAQAKGVALPSELDTVHKRMAERMVAQSGEAFDRAYLDRAGVYDHKKTHDMLRKAQSRAKDPELKALVARILPVVEQHMAAVQQLSKDTARGSSRTQGTTGSSEKKE
jgi:putative membrane protein